MTTETQEIDHEANVIAACNELGGYEVVWIVAKWLETTLAESPHIQARQDIKERILQWASELKAGANGVLG